MLIILIAILLLIVPVTVIIILNYRHTKTSEALFAARQEVARLKGRLGAASKAARDFEERCSHLMRQLNTSMASTGQALNVARHIEVIGQQMTQLLELVAYSDGQHAADAGQPAVEYSPPAQLEPPSPYGPRAITGDPVDVPAHHHVNHTQPLSRAPWALHPGQRRAG